MCVWVNAGKCSSAAPETVPDDITSIAFAMASSSSSRIFWRASNSSDFVVHCTLRSAKYFSSSFSVALVDSTS